MTRLGARKRSLQLFFGEHVAHFLPLSVQVFLSLSFRVCDKRYVFHDLQTVALKAGDLLGVIRHKAQFVKAQIRKNLRAESIVS